MAEFLRNSDAFAVGMETDAALRSTVVTIFVLDRAPDFDEVRSRFDRVARTLPMFRQRVVHTLPPAPPRWEDDPDFDLDFHIRQVTAPAPGDLDTVLEMARRAEMSDFDRARPMWEVTVIDGLDLEGPGESAGGRAAVLVKIHHSMTDGVGGVELAMTLFDITPEGTDRGPMPEQPTPHVGGRLAPYSESARYDASLAAGALKGLVKGAPGAIAAGIRRPRRTATEVAATAASVYRTVRPINRTGSPLMTERRLVRRLDVHEVPVASMKAAAKSCGASLNDAFLASVAGGLRLYHERHGVEVGDLHVTMPVSLRTADDSIGGNRITLMRFDVTVGEPDARTRVQRIHERAGFVRGERSLPYTQAIAGALMLLPRWYLAFILRNVDFLCSDVPGIPVPVYLGGAKVLMQYPFGPTIGAGVNVTLMSYVGTCALGINADTGAIPDFEVFMDCLREGFDEVLALAP